MPGVDEGRGQVAPFVCPRCGKGSWHPEDARQGYCSVCHWWTGDALLGCPEVLAQAEADGAIEPLPEPGVMTRG